MLLQVMQPAVSGHNEEVKYTRFQYNQSPIFFPVNALFFSFHAITPCADAANTAFRKQQKPAAKQRMGLYGVAMQVPNWYALCNGTQLIDTPERNHTYAANFEPVNDGLCRTTGSSKFVALNR